MSTVTMTFLLFRDAQVCIYSIILTNSKIAVFHQMSKTKPQLPVTVTQILQHNKDLLGFDNLAGNATHVCFTFNGQASYY